MKNQWQTSSIVTSRTDPCPVTEFIDRLAPKHQIKIIRFSISFRGNGADTAPPVCRLFKRRHPTNCVLSFQATRIRNALFFLFSQIHRFFILPLSKTAARFLKH